MENCLKIKIQNFKGVKEFEGEIANSILSGKNKSGKTSILSAIAWVLCDYDIHGDSNVKPQIDGKDVDVTIRVELEFNGMKIAKEQREKYEKNKLTLESRFKGNEKKYFFNGEEVLKKDFSVHVDLFQHKLMSLKDSILSMCVPGYFSIILEEKVREAVVYSFMPNVTTKDVAEALGKPDMAEWYDGLKDAEAERKKLVTLANSLDKEARENSSKIDENLRNIPETRVDMEGLLRRKEEIESEIEEANKKLNSGTAQMCRSEIQSELKVARAEHEAAKSSFFARKADFERKEKTRAEEESEKLNANRKNIIAQNAEIERENESRTMVFQYAMKNYNSTVDFNKQKISRLNAQIEEKRKLFVTEKEKTVEAVFCPRINEPCVMSVESFNLEKSNRLEAINKKGKELVAERDALNSKVFDKPVSPIKVPLLDVPEEIVVKPGEFKESFYFVFDEKVFEDRLLAVESEDFSAEIKFIEEKKSELEDINHEIFSAKEIIRTEKRIKDLEEERSAKLKDYTEKQEKIAFIQDFSIKKANLLEPKAEEVFGMSIKLFDFQVNQTPKPCCRFMVGDTDIAHANEASQVKYGIEICQKLQSLHGVSLPLLIENAKGFDNRDKLSPLINKETIFVAEMPDDHDLQIIKKGEEK